MQFALAACILFTIAPALLAEPDPHVLAATKYMRDALDYPVQTSNPSLKIESAMRSLDMAERSLTKSSSGQARMMRSDIAGLRANLRALNLENPGAQEVALKLLNSKLRFLSSPGAHAPPGSSTRLFGVESGEAAEVAQGSAAHPAGAKGFDLKALARAAAGKLAKLFGKLH